MSSHVGSYEELAWERYEKGVDLICATCKQEKPAHEYNKWEAGRTKGSRCRRCMAAAGRRSYEKRKKEHIARCHKWNVDNRELRREIDLRNWHIKQKGELNSHAKRRLHYASLSEEGKDDGQ